jgi:hypothetical protein
VIAKCLRDSMPGCRRILERAAASLLLTFAIVADAQPTVVSAPSREWTILVFMNGKNSLERFAIENFKELAVVGSTSEVSFVVQMGRPLVRKKGEEDVARVYDGWSGVRRFLVSKNQTPATGQEVEIVGGGEVDMGAPATLEAFLRWGKAKYPAKRYAVVIWNHGQGYRLIASARGAKAARRSESTPQTEARIKPTHRAISQDRDTGSIIYNADVHMSLTKSFKDELKLVGFDACLMGMLETAYELKDATPVVVASEELEPGRGWNYTKLARAITGAPLSNEFAFATMIVTSYGDNYRNVDEATTLSAVRTEKIAAVATELSVLSGIMLADQQNLFPLVMKARAQRGAYNNPDNPVTIDLIGFLNALETELRAKTPGSPALEQTQKTRAAALAAIAKAYASKSRSEPFGSYGLAIYFPLSKRAFYSDPWSDGYVRGNAYKPVTFVDKERWSDFLAAYLGL